MASCCMRPVGLNWLLLKPDWLLELEAPGVVLGYVLGLPLELDEGSVEDPPAELDEVCDCAPSARHAPHSTNVLSNCFLITCLS
jgi:hypothetical protein